MKIKVERSGGFAGISTSSEIEAERLPSSIEDTVRKLLVKKKLPSMKREGLTRPKTAADYFNYKITIQDAKKAKVVEYDEYNMDSSVKSLVSYVQENSMKQ